MENAKEKFYEAVGTILGVDHTYKVPYAAYTHANRWNNRAAGNGRYPGFGVIRYYGPTLIHIAVTSPKTVTTSVKSEQEALDLLRSIIKGDTLI